MKELFFRSTIIMLSVLGLWGAGSISIAHWTNERLCPTIGLLPACYVVLLGYGLILLSMYPCWKKPIHVFLIGWIPVISLALLGVVGELTSTLHCPHSETGVPKCYFSAILGLSIGLLYWLFYKVSLRKLPV